MTTNTDNEQTELLPCPNPECRTEKVVASGDYANHYVYCSNCFLRGPRESADSFGARWNSLPRVSASSAAPVVDGISWTALLSVLERLRGKNRNPDNEWYHGWNAAIQCLINDINSRAASPASTQEDAEHVSEP